MKNVASLGNQKYLVSYAKQNFTMLYVYKINFNTKTMTSLNFQTINEDIHDIYSDKDDWFICAKNNGIISRGSHLDGNLFLYDIHLNNTLQIRRVRPGRNVNETALATNRGIMFITLDGYEIGKNETIKDDFSILDFHHADWKNAMFIQEGKGYCKIEYEYPGQTVCTGGISGAGHLASFIDFHAWQYPYVWVRTAEKVYIVDHKDMQAAESQPINGTVKAITTRDEHSCYIFTDDGNIAIWELNEKLQKPLRRIHDYSFEG